MTLKFPERLIKVSNSSAALYFKFGASQRDLLATPAFFFTDSFSIVFQGCCMWLRADPIVKDEQTVDRQPEKRTAYCVKELRWECCMTSLCSFHRTVYRSLKNDISYTLIDAVRLF